MLADEPRIARTMRDGYPEDERTPICPICGSECDSLYFDHYGDCVGCDECIRIVDAWEEMQDV